MSSLRMGWWTMPGAELGGENPFPALASGVDVHLHMQMDESVPAEDRKYAGYGGVPGCLPYQLQDQYDRGLRERRFRMAVLENETLRAVFLTELGGRLWSLTHKLSGRELLAVNPVFQPANLAIRNAWFSGGVEWNMGVVGHSPFTCSPLFAARAEFEDGTPVLRMYEWERIRQAPFQIDAYLPDGSAVLLVRVRIVNPHDHEIPMYWWSNMAVPETPGMRVVVPAERSLTHTYGGRIGMATVPRWEGRDMSYAVHVPRSKDFFYCIPDGHRPWIAALDKDGRGLVQTSTGRLRGRKMFVWGMGPGGRRWQEWLSPSGAPYIEVQAGLARTQAEHLPMPGRSEWCWLEAYGLMQAPGDAVHGEDWRRACDTVEERLEGLVPRAYLDAELERGKEMAGRKPVQILGNGSGWGALERLRREKAGESPLCGESMLFGRESIGPAQRPWLALLRQGGFRSGKPEQAPGAYMVQREWRGLLEAAAKEKRHAHWPTWLHLGVMRHYAGEKTGAREAWRNSLRDKPSAWAWRNLAVSARQEGRRGEAADLYVAAHRLSSGSLPLLVECGRALLEARRAGDWLALLRTVSPALRDAGRIRLLEGRAALETGDLDGVEGILERRIMMEDLREGEQSWSDLWYGLQERRVSVAEGVPVDAALRERVRRECRPPAELDFRMGAEG